ncbi:unnamed protein product, partial [Cladocopium goreaui]
GYGPWSYATNVCGTGGTGSTRRDGVLVQSVAWEGVVRLAVGVQRRPRDMGHMASDRKGRRSSDESAEAKYVGALLHKTGETFEWPIDQGNQSKGSLGHPEVSWILSEVCGRFCIRFFYGNCRQGQNCEFCHLTHREPKVKMDKAQRQLIEMLGEAEANLGSRIPNQRMVFVIDMLRRRFQSLPVPNNPNRVLHARAVIPVLRKFTVARLLEPFFVIFWADLGRELIRQSPAVPSGQDMTGQKSSRALGLWIDPLAAEKTAGNC